MRFKALKMVKVAGQWYNPGQIFETSDKKIIQELKQNDAAENTNLTKDISPLEELMTVKGVNKAIAEKLINLGVDSVNKLSGETIKDLVKMGLTEKEATTIFKSFE